MKKGVLIILGMLMMVSTIEAKNNNELNNFEINYSYDNAVNFIEKGVEFYIFTNGDFDFNILYNQNHTIIHRDYRGRISRIGSVFIDYDFNGNVSRIGNIPIRYYRGRLTNVGNLRVHYDRFGHPDFHGYVKDNFYTHNGVRINLNIGDIYDYNHSYFTHRDFDRHYTQIREDNHYYYYRANTTTNIGKRSQILRRRKPVVTTPNRRVTTTRNNIYRKPATVQTPRRTVTTTTSRRNTSYTKPVVNTRKTTSTATKPRVVNTDRVSRRR